MGAINVNGTGAWLVLGAGVSAQPPASVPLWGTMKTRLIEQVCEVLADLNDRLWHNDESRYAFRDAKRLLPPAVYPEAVMECLSHAYGRLPVRDMLCRCIGGPRGSRAPNGAHAAIAQLCRRQQIAGIITTNFDTLLEEALKKAGVPYEVHLDDLPEMPQAIPILKLHGSLHDPSSLHFVRGDYYRRLSLPLAAKMRQRLGAGDLILCGYSGCDIDLFPVLRDVIRTRAGQRRATVVDPRPLGENTRYAPLEANIRYVQRPAGEFFCELAQLPACDAGRPRASEPLSLLPHTNPFECVVFLADCRLAVGDWPEAFRLFFLAQDIAEDSGDMIKLPLAMFGKSLALHGLNDVVWAESEYSAGRTLLADICSRNSQFATAEIFKQFAMSLDSIQRAGAQRRFSTGGVCGRMDEGKSRINYSVSDAEDLRHLLGWEFRARRKIALAALRAAGCAADAGGRDRMLTVAQSLFADFAPSNSPLQGSRGEPMPLPVIFRQFVSGYAARLGGSGASSEDLEKCLDACRPNGFYEEAAYCLYLLGRRGEEYRSIIDLCELNEQTDIVLTLTGKAKPFGHTVTSYTPPPPRSDMKKYQVVHIQGVEGYGEKNIVETTATALSARDAIASVAPVEHLQGWDWKGSGDSTAGLFNPAAANRSQEYCDYWFASEEE